MSYLGWRFWVCMVGVFLFSLTVGFLSYPRLWVIIPAAIGIGVLGARLAIAWEDMPRVSTGQFTAPPVTPKRVMQKFWRDLVR